MWVQSLNWEDPLEEGMEAHSSILAWRIPWTEEPGRLQFIGSQRVKHNPQPKRLSTHASCVSFLSCCNLTQALTRSQMPS